MSISVTITAIAEAYAATKSVWKAAELVGLCGQTVHERLRSAGIKTSSDNTWTDEELDKLKAWYAGSPHRDTMNLSALAESIGKLKSNVCRKARSLGLTNSRRRHQSVKQKNKYNTIAESRAAIGSLTRQRIAEKGHPKGMLGKRHSEATKMVISWSSRTRWNSMTKEQREDHTEKAVKTRVMRNTPPRGRTETTWKAGWREIGGRRIYARSRWEANIARFLEFRKSIGDIKDWEHEPITFWFEKIKRGVRSYKPDFRITENDGSTYYIEVKGWMDARSKTTLKRMKKYYPSIRIDLIEAKRYKGICRQSGMISGWES